MRIMWSHRDPAFRKSGAPLLPACWLHLGVNGSARAVVHREKRDAQRQLIIDAAAPAACGLAVALHTP